MGPPPTINPQPLPIAAKPHTRRFVWMIILAVVVIVTIILIVVIPPRTRDYEQHLSGFWSGDPAFLKEAGLSQMDLYIAPCMRRDGGRRRRGYLLMIDSKGVLISNQGIEIAYGGSAERWKSAFKSHFFGGADEAYHIPIAEFSYDDDDVMPDDMQMGLNTTESTLALYTKEKLYAYFVKDNETSIFANKGYNASAPA